jgi:hypothetical protein
MIVHTDRCIEIIPAKTPRALIVYFAVLGLAVLIATQLVLAVLPYFPEKWLVSACSAAVALGFGAICLVIRVAFSREQARGPILLISFAEREVRLPREGKSWPIDRVVRWDIVSGRHLRPKGMYDEPCKLSHGLLELQMIVDDAGELTAWPLIGATSWNDPMLLDESKKIAQRMGLPVAVIDEADHSGKVWRTVEEFFGRPFRSGH